MESASSQTPSAFEPASISRKRNWGALPAIAAVITLMLLLSRGDLRWTHTALVITSVLGVLLLGGLWHLHLKSVLPGWSWPSALPPILAVQLTFLVLRTQVGSTGEWVGALGSGIFVYLMLWIFATYEREEGLQALATGALLLSGGILTKPAVAVSCVLLSLIFFLLRGRRHAAGALGFALLLFTPAMLCAISLAILSSVAGRVFGGFLADLSVFHVHATSAAPTVDPALIACLRAGLAFSLAATIARIVEGTAGVVDKAYGAFLLFLTLAWIVHRMPVPLNAADVSMVAYGGGAILVTLAAPRSWFGRLLIFLGRCAPLLFLLHRHS